MKAFAAARARFVCGAAAIAARPKHVLDTLRAIAAREAVTAYALVCGFVANSISKTSRRIIADARWLMKTCRADASTIRPASALPRAVGYGIAVNVAIGPKHALDAVRAIVPCKVFVACTTSIVAVPRSVPLTESFRLYLKQKVQNARGVGIAQVFGAAHVRL